jgi:cation diffusion facilitator family transporter
VTDHARSASRDLTLIASASIAVALIVMGIKYWAYLVTGSVALFSDALESVVNVVTAVVALVTIRISVRPADRQHQFGHHKAEYFSAVLEGALIIVAALLILHEAWAALIKPRMPTEPLLGIAVSTLASLLNGVWAAFLVIIGTRRNSPALVADGWHLFTDLATTIGVLAGLGLVWITELTILDPLLAAAVAINILWTGWRLTRQSVSSLMDEAVDADVGGRIRGIISSNAEGAIEVHDLRTRSAGRATFIEFHMVVPGEMTVANAHRICDRIEEAIQSELHGAEVIIHVEPEGEARHHGVLVL